MKKIVLTIAIVLGLTFGASAQIFMMEEEAYLRNGEVTPDFNIDNPDGFGQGTDFYAPVGSGTLLLAGLGGAYLLGKKRKN